MLLERLDALDGVLDKYSAELGEDLIAYRNHAYRVANLCAALRPADEAGIDKIAVAAAFHDLGIWTAQTFDYLAPSADLACDHLRCTGHGDWQEDIAGMIHEHHKVRRYRGTGADVVEPFRRADWIDVSRGLLSFGLPRTVLRAIFLKWPNAGFHKRLVQLTLREARAHPLRPIPALKW
ncbi:MAG TPA: hypothetical protein VFO82_11095 [Steroidobacteraceae bacterium]|nr:hypothetical protein [Steroidobacteraceae bacterium]